MLSTAYITSSRPETATGWCASGVRYHAPLNRRAPLPGTIPGLDKKVTATFQGTRACQGSASFLPGTLLEEVGP